MDIERKDIEKLPEKPNQNEWYQNHSRRWFGRNFWTGLLFAVTLVASIIVVTVSLTASGCDNDKQEINLTKQTDIHSRLQRKTLVPEFIFTQFLSGHDTDFTPADKLRMIPRIEWLANPVGKPLDPLHHPVPYVIISHSATEQCEIQAACTLQVRLIQTIHIESKGWWDIGYNFLVGGDGYCYVGRGWDYVGAHAYGYNNKSIGINFIGTFNTVLPPKKQLRAAKLVIEEGVKLGMIAPDYKLLAHRQVSGTESPGKRLYEELQTWPHWAEKP